LRRERFGNQGAEGEDRRAKRRDPRVEKGLFGLKPSKKGKSGSSLGCATPHPRKRDPPFGHKGTSRKKPERVDKTVILRFDACPCCGGALNELEEVRERYEEEIVPVPILVIKYLVNYV
jgi:hypothetical protein